MLRSDSTYFPVLFFYSKETNESKLNPNRISYNTDNSQNKQHVKKLYSNKDINNKDKNPLSSTF